MGRSTEHQSAFGAYTAEAEARGQEPFGWLLRFWPILIGLVALIGAWTKINNDVGGKLDREEYVKDQAAVEKTHARENATRDSIAGVTLYELRSLHGAVCRIKPGTC